MATNPKATTSVDAQAGATGAGVNTISVMAPVPTLPDVKPRLFGTAKAIFEQHGYSEGVEYSARHLEESGGLILFTGIPIAVPGVVGRFNDSGNSGTSVVTVAALGDGVLQEHDGILRVLTGGTVGADQIMLEISLDAGLSFQRIKLSTATSFTPLYVGVQISFAAGTLVTGDTPITWHGTGPSGDSAGWVAARTALGLQDKQFRTNILMGDLQVQADGAAYRAQMEAYETANERFIVGRASLKDRQPEAAMAQVRARMTGAPTLTFAEVGATGDTITRNDAGSFLSDGFVVGDFVDITGSASNDGSGRITGVTASLLTFDTYDLVDEVGAPDVVLTSSPSLIFAEVGATGDTITRNRGSFLDDGFRVGDFVVIAGTVSNSFTAVAALTGVSGTVLTFDTDDLTPEEISSYGVTLTAGQTKAAWMADLDAEFAPVTTAFRVNFSAGRGSRLSPWSAWNFRIPTAWAASIREYQHDLHITTWQKDLGNLGMRLTDVNGDPTEWNDDTDGGAGSAAGFTTMRTWQNGPQGAYIAQDLTRETEGNILTHMAHAAVTNIACTTVQTTTENAIGRSLILEEDGTATPQARSEIEKDVNDDLEVQMFGDFTGEGQRASQATWTMSKEDVLNVAEPTVTGVLLLRVRGIIHSINTIVRVR